MHSRSADRREIRNQPAVSLEFLHGLYCLTRLKIKFPNHHSVFSRRLKLYTSFINSHRITCRPCSVEAVRRTVDRICLFWVLIKFKSHHVSVSKKLHLPFHNSTLPALKVGRVGPVLPRNSINVFESKANWNLCSLGYQSLAKA